MSGKVLDLIEYFISIYSQFSYLAVAKSLQSTRTVTDADADDDDADV